MERKIRGVGERRKQRRQNRVDMNSMNHRTLSSSPPWMYDPQHLTDPFLTSMYVCIYVCTYVCVNLYASVCVYLGQGPLLPGCLAKIETWCDGGLG